MTVAQVCEPAVFTSLQTLEAAIQQEFALTPGAFAIAFRNLSNSQESLYIKERETFHAASTMKTSVMIEVYKQAASGRLSLNDSVLVKNEFTSIVDGSSFCLNVTDDSNQDLYDFVGKKKALRELVYDMVIQRSNLATNLVIELVDARRITQTMRQLGAKDIQVLRGVEDTKAFEKGLNNTITAYDLMVIYEKMAQGEVLSHRASDDMIQTLLDQADRSIIPAHLPSSVKVAHKTGNIQGVYHDSGIVYLPNGKKYVLVLLSKDLENQQEGKKTLANVSELVYQFMISR
ncbi:MAG: serine hydrolase [Bacteroidota bacterium]